MRVLYVAPHFHTFVRDQIAALRPGLEAAEGLALRPWWSSMDPLGDSVTGDAASDLPTTTHRSLLLATRWPRPLASWSGSVRRLRRRLRDGRFGLLHAHFLYPPGAVAAEAAAAEGIPLVATAHGFDVYRLPFRNAAWRRAIARAATAAGRVITVSRRNAGILAELGVPEARLRLIPNGFDPGAFHPGDRAEARRPLGLPAEARLVAAVGHLVPVKGFDVLLDAMAELPQDTHLVLVGRGAEREALEDRARRRAIASRVTFAGEVPHARVGEYLRAADAVAIPSRDEGNPTVLVEALACGRPVVATAVGGIPDVLDSRQGLLVPAGDPRALAEGLRATLASPRDEAGIAAAAAAYSWNALAARILDVYREAEAGA
jgi:glycosyltransferase involved in cell wall biosynthesis